MAILVQNISLPFAAGEQAAFEAAVGRLGLSYTAVQNIYVIKRSLDARKREDIRFVYAIGVELQEEAKEAALLKRTQSPHIKAVSHVPIDITPGRQMLSTRPVVVGFGPAGMFAALLLARHGYRPLVLERGSDVDQRAKDVEAYWQAGRLNPESNIQFGEGGAGTFSDGKLTTRIGDPRCDYVLSAFCQFGAPKDIATQAKPHIGTDHLRQVVKNIRQEIIRLGGEVRFQSRVEDFCFQHGALAALRVGGMDIPAQAAILAVGHSARDTAELCYRRGFALVPKGFSVGVRIEHPQSVINEGLYGSYAGHPLLPPGEYQLSHREGERGVYTFCMCPGGVVVPAASEIGGIVTNGMSHYARDGAFCNSALVVSVLPQDSGNTPLGGIALQRQLEAAAFACAGDGKAPGQSVDSFLCRRPGFSDGAAFTYAMGVTPADFNRLLPPFVTELLHTGLHCFNDKLKGFTNMTATLTGMETRTSSPLRVLRGENLEAIGLAGVCPCGEGAGYAGGIMSAAVDGMRAAIAIIERYACPNSIE